MKIQIYIVKVAEKAANLCDAELVVTELKSACENDTLWFDIESKSRFFKDSA